MSASPKPDHTAVRVALWRALHLEHDRPPIFNDDLALKLANPEEGWRARPDMHPDWTKGFRASVVSRARFVEDLVEEKGFSQYVILGAGLDTFAQRSPIAPRMTVFEIDAPAQQAWKRQRLEELKLGVPSHLKLVPVDFESESWWEELQKAGFDPKGPAVVSSTGVSMYLTREAIGATLTQVAKLAKGTTLAMTYMLPMELTVAEERPGRERAEAGAKASGTPFISFFTPDQAQSLAKQCGFTTARSIPAADYEKRYFANRTDGLRPAMSEEILLATV